MKAVITGDIINSREIETTEWLNLLKSILNQYGKSPKYWEIYRGDSFQLLVEPKEALNAAFIIKAGIKQIKSLDVRLAVGIGEINHEAEKITEANGTAFIFSGECFDRLKKQTLAIKTASKENDQTINLLLEIVSSLMDKWTPTSSEIIFNKLQYPEISQKELALKLKKESQSAISEGLKRGAYDEIKKVLDFYQEKTSLL